MSVENIFAVNCTGSDDVVRGFGGYGIYGSVLKTSKRPSSIKHPTSAKHHFTTQGVAVTKDELPYETTHVVESIGSVVGAGDNGELATILAITEAYKIAVSLDELSKITFFIPNSAAFNDVVNVVVNFAPLTERYYVQWTILLNEREEALRKFPGLKEEFIFRPENDEDGYLCSKVAKFYSLVGINVGSVPPSALEAPFETELHNVTFLSVQSPKLYKAEFEGKGCELFFNSIHFSSNPATPDDSYCFVAKASEAVELGKRLNTNQYGIIQGKLPTYISDCRKLYRSIERSYIINCFIDLTKLSNKLKLRIANRIGIRAIIYLAKTSYDHYRVIGEEGIFIGENTREYPYIIDAMRGFYSMTEFSAKHPAVYKAPATVSDGGLIRPEGQQLSKEDFPELFKALSEWGAAGAEFKLPEVSIPDETETYVSADITPMVVTEGKLIVKNTNNDLHVTKLLHAEDFSPLTSVNVEFGRDAPSYLALKNVEEDIKKVTVVFINHKASNYATMLVYVDLGDYVICTTNLPDKFLVKKFA